jgi:hypothetical protein
MGLSAYRSIGIYRHGANNIYEIDLFYIESPWKRTEELLIL